MSSAGKSSDTRRRRYACTDWWLFIVWMVCAGCVGAATYQWRYGADILAAAASALVASMLSIIAIYMTATRRAWRVVLDRRASLDDRLAAIRIAWSWSAASRTLFDPVRDKVTGDYWYPGLRGFEIDDDGLVMAVLMPRGVHYDRSVWEKPAMNHDMADILQVTDVRDPQRRGNMVTYLVVPVDATEDVRRAR